MFEDHSDCDSSEDSDFGTSEPAIDRASEEKDMMKDLLIDLTLFIRDTVDDNCLDIMDGRWDANDLAYFLSKYSYELGSAFDFF